MSKALASEEADGSEIIAEETALEQAGGESKEVGLYLEKQMEKQIQRYRDRKSVV